MTDMLESGDIIQTNWGTATVCFEADSSLLRLDTGTVVALEAGNLGGKTVAQAILSDGRLWWRVLTSTGINIGGGGLIAGVRGTSVSVEKTGTQYKLSIIDSQRPTDAADIQNTMQAWVTPIPTPAGQQFTYLSWATSTSPATVPKSTILSLSAWARENMKKDIDYLMGLPQDAPQITAERAIATPRGIAEQDAICIDYPGVLNWRWWSDTVKCQPRWLIAYADYTKGTELVLGYTWTLGQKISQNTCPNKWKESSSNSPYSNDSDKECWKTLSASCDPWQIVIAHTMSCLAFTTIVGATPYNPKVVGSKPYGINGWEDDCQVYDEHNPDPSKHLEPNYSLDATSGGGKLDIWCASPGTQNIQNIGSNLTASTNGVSITQTGQYLSYATSSLPSLAGKTITIEFEGSLPDGNNGLGNELWNVILDLWNNIRILRSGAWDWTCILGVTNHTTNCTVSNTTPFLVTPNWNTISIKINSWISISRLVIGNSQESNYKQPINRSINKIIISN
jgi:hypothetical protein